MTATDPALRLKDEPAPPLMDDIEPCANERLDRFLTGFVTVVAFLWPDTYISTAVMRITPQQVPDKLVPAVITTQMAERLHIAEKTVGHHVEHIYNKIGRSTRAGAALFAMENEP